MNSISNNTQNNVNKNFFSSNGLIVATGAVCLATLLFIRCNRNQTNLTNPSQTLFNRAFLKLKDFCKISPIASKGLDKNWVQNVPKDPKCIIDTDAGNDPDDIFALFYSAREFGKKIKLVTTTLYRPEEKAKISEICLSEFKFPKILISSGYGAYKGEEESWLEKYPCWPVKFGIPGKTNQVSLFQAEAFRKHYSEFDSLKISERTASQDISKLCTENTGDIVIIAQASLTNLAQAFSSMHSINRIVMMGGWFEDEKGGISRLGYNTAVDLKASKVILEQDKVPVLIVNAELVKKLRFTITDKEREILLKSSHKPKIAKAICDDMHLYWENRIPKRGELGLADMLTAYISKHPEAIARSRPIKITFNDSLLNVDMFHPDSKKVLSVSTVPESNVHVIEELIEPNKIRLDLVLMLFELFYPNVNKETIREFIQLDQSPESIADRLNMDCFSKL